MIIGRTKEIEREQRTPLFQFSEPVIDKTNNLDFQTSFLKPLPADPVPRVFVRIEASAGRGPDVRRIGSFQKEKSPIVDHIAGDSYEVS